MTGTDESVAYVGQWNQLMIGMRKNLVIEASRDAGDAFKNGQVAIRAYMRADVQVSQAAAFVEMSGITAS